MKQFSIKWKRFTAFGLALLLAFGATHLSGVGISKVEASSTPQPIPFTQDWTANLIIANDDWSPVTGIVGFLGNYVTASPTNVDPRTLIADFATNDVDVIANQTNPDTNSSGGAAEFDGIANPTVALQGSGTADAPHIVLYLNTTGRANVRVSYNARDIDASVDNAVQQINTQYRVGNAGDWINLPGGYIADATTGPNLATLVTPVSVALPSAADNQPMVQVRIITTNAAGSDEWVGIDDISVTTAATAAPNRANVDFDGDSRSDYAVTRNDSGSKIWFVNPAGSSSFTGAQFGINTDIEVPEDYDGDGRDDIAVWRAGTQAYFYILRSSDNTFQYNPFGQTGDDPRVVADYDGDGRSEFAVVRSNGNALTWFVLTRTGASFAVLFGLASDVVAPGDYDGDGKQDIAVWRPGANSSPSIFYSRRSSDNTLQSVAFGAATDYPAANWFVH